MASLGATAVISTSVPMRNWARLTVTDADAGLDAGGEAGRAMGMIAQPGSEQRHHAHATRRSATDRRIRASLTERDFFSRCRGTACCAPTVPVIMSPR